MSQVNSQIGKMPTTNDAIVKAFNQLLIAHQSSGSKIATKEEEAEKEKNRQLLSKTVDYTVNNIVNGMASLQLSFGSVVSELAENLTIESDKLSELKKAIAVEKEYLQYLNKVRLVADALHILDQEHDEQIKLLQGKTKQEKEEIEQEIKLVKKRWAKEEQEFAIKVQETTELISLQRKKEEANYQYELERQRTIETDDYEEDKRLQQRELEELKIAKNKDWTAREKYLEDNIQEFLKNQEKIATFEEKLKEEYNKAKASAIKEADNKYKVAAELEEKEWSAREKGYQLKIESLSTVIDRQIEQITETTAQLQEANTQAQNLAMQAFQ